MTLWSTAREVLMFDGFIDPDTASHLACLISDREPYLLDMTRFGGAQLLVGNILMDHKPLSRPILPAYWRLRRWWRQRCARFSNRDSQTCVCGWSSRTEVFEYHQADMVNEAVRRYISEVFERIEQR
jgi:hypothetical protein